MKVAYFLFVSMFCCFTIPLLAHKITTFNPKNYVYDDEGNPLFIKIYTKSLDIEFSQAEQFSFSSSGTESHLLSSMIQIDTLGSFLPVPIQKKKKSSDDDDDESSWICPYCGTENTALSNICANKDCVLYRKKGRDWLCN